MMLSLFKIKKISFEEIEKKFWLLENQKKTNLTMKNYF